MDVRTALLTLAIRLLALHETPAEPRRDLVLFLAPADRGVVDARALLDAVATYTRDLRVRVQLVRTDALAAGAGAREAVVALARARAARLAFWCAPGADAGSLVLHIVDARGAARSDAIGGAARGGDRARDPAAADLHRAVALKLRAVLAVESAPGPAAGERGSARPGERAPARELEPGAAVMPPGAAAPLATVAPPSPAAPPPIAPARVVAAPPPEEVAAPNVSPPAPLPAPDDATPGGAATLQAPTRAGADAAAPALRWRGLFASAGYGLAYAAGNAPLRQGLALHGIAGLAWPVELDAGVEWAPSSQRTVASGTLSLRDIPVRLGARFVHRGQRLLAGVGAFGAAHVLFASASSPAGHQDRTTAAGGLGVEAVGRGVLGGRVSWEVRLWAERLVPRTRFLVGDEPALDTGAFTLGLGAGVAFPTR